MQTTASRPPWAVLARRGLVFLFLLFLCRGACVAQTVTLSVHNASLESVFKEIDRQSGYRIVYPNLSGTHPVSLNVKDEPFRRTLDSALKGQPFEYTIVQHTVAVRRKTTPENAEKKPAEVASP